jgi:hypothetical protein
MRYLTFLFALAVLFPLTVSAQNQSAYLQVGNTSDIMPVALESVKQELTKAGFKIIGEYNPGNMENLAVVCYTRADLEKIALGFSDRGALAAALKIGLKKEENTITISMLNPMYLFYAYLLEGMDKQEEALSKISDDAKAAMKSFGSEFKRFGGELDKDKLQKYHYKVMMPYFTDPEKLKEFSSFEEGLKVIQANLSAGKGKTKKVYELIYPDKKVAVFGVALLNQEDGESKFLPIIGDDNIAAMPYEMILQGNTLTILPGRYRIALHWPELTMGTFMKIMSTPGDISNTLKGLTE